MSIVRRLVYKTFKKLAGPEMAALDSDCRELEAAQLRKLRQILQANAATAFGKEHDFASITTADEFRRRLPVRDYEAHRPYIDRLWNGEDAVLSAERPLMFATTSGTMGKPKYIPVTPSYIKEFRHASVASGYFTLQHFPDIAKGVTLSVFSPASEGLSPGGIPYGAISGGLYLKEPFLVKKYISPIPYEVYLTRDYESKYYALLRCALVLPVSCFYTLNPSTIVVLLKRLEKYGPVLIKDIAEGGFSPPQAVSSELEKAMKPFLGKDPERARQLWKLLETGSFCPEKIWPLLQVVCCWTKASAAFYVKDFESYFGKIPVCDISYGASEGRGTVSMGDGRQLLSIRSHFFEFIREADIEKENAPVFLAHELQISENYYILFTTSAGLYRYHINDVVKVVGYHKNCPLIEFQYKGGNVSSFTGEKLTELQVTEAMKAILQKRGKGCRFFTLIPEFKPNPHYELLYEPEAGEEFGEGELLEFSKSLDQELAALNVEYKVKRESQRLDRPETHLLRLGAYEDLRKQMSAAGVADAQIKLSHLNPKAEVREYFQSQLIKSGTSLAESRPLNSVPGK